MDCHGNMTNKITLNHVNLGASDRLGLSWIDRRMRPLVERWRAEGHSTSSTCERRHRLHREASLGAGERGAYAWVSIVCEKAATGRRLGMLKWAREQDPPCSPVRHVHTEYSYLSLHGKGRPAGGAEVGWGCWRGCYFVVWVIELYIRSASKV